MATLQMGNKTLFTQTGSADPVMDSGVDLTNADMSNANIKPSFSSLDTSASQGPTTDLTNTTLPIFACRAWVNFNGNEVTTVGSESHCTIRASGNISKVVRNGTGDYTVYFVTEMPDANYVVSGLGSVQPGGSGWGDLVIRDNNETPQTTHVRLGHIGYNAWSNCNYAMVAIFR